MSKPIYEPNFFSTLPDGLLGMVEGFNEHLLSLNWVTKRTARHEYFMAKTPTEYSYGNSGTGEENYTSEEMSSPINAMMNFLNDQDGLNYTGCFLNKYDDEKQHLGWHADDFPGMDPAHPIGVVSFGAEREIWVKPQSQPCPDCLSGRPGICKSMADMPSGQVARDGEPICDTCRGMNRIPVKGIVPNEDRYKLEQGSLFTMPAGYQDTHFHRIPKHDRPCGWRISLTFRSFS